MTRMNLDEGLTTSQVRERIRLGQVNVVNEQTSRSLWSIVSENIFTLFNATLSVAVVIVLIFGQPQDAVFAGVMVVNAVIGVISEWRAKRTLDALAIVDAPTARVRRDGGITEIPVQEIVTDDIIELRLGDQVSVDGALLNVRGLEVDESMLTGESRPVRKNIEEDVLAGTSVVAGSGLMRARAVGEATYAQGIARAARKFSRTHSEIQESINRVLRVISALLIPVVALTMWSQTRVADASAYSWQNALVLAVASIVGMIPQGLVLLTSMNFAIGSATLARRGVLVQELPAVEVLARVDSLFLDKTGTLTTGKIRVKDLHLLADAVLEDVERALGVLSSDKTNATADAIYSHIRAGNIDDDELTHINEEDRIAFSSERKWSGFRDGTGTWMLGAPEILLSENHSAENTAALERTALCAAEGNRVIALTYSPERFQTDDLPTQRHIRALVVLEEDVRPDAAQTLQYFKEQGVHVRIISGDNPTTVEALAAQVGVTASDGSAPRAIDARTLPEDTLSVDFKDAVESHEIFGRVTPEQKHAMVQCMQAEGHCVAMTGDGVNDALALKDADLGIAMGNGARATKAVAQIVLVDSQFAELPNVLAEGRRIIANMERVSSLFLTKTCYAAVMVIVCAIAALPFPFLPRHYTYVGAYTIGIPAFFIALGPNLRRYVPGFLQRTLALAIPSGIITAAASLVTYTWVGAGTTAGRSAATLTLALGALWVLSITARPLVPWRFAILLVMTGGALFGVLIPPVRDFFALTWPTTHDWMIILGSGVISCVLIEIAYRAYHHRLHMKAQAIGSQANYHAGRNAEFH